MGAFGSRRWHFVQILLNQAQNVQSGSFARLFYQLFAIPDCITTQQQYYQKDNVEWTTWKYLLEFNMAMNCFTDDSNDTSLSFFN